MAINGRKAVRSWIQWYWQLRTNQWWILKSDKGVNKFEIWSSGSLNRNCEIPRPNPVAESTAASKSVFHYQYWPLLSHLRPRLKNLNPTLASSNSPKHSNVSILPPVSPANSLKIHLWSVERAGDVIGRYESGGRSIEWEGEIRSVLNTIKYSKIGIMCQTPYQKYMSLFI